MTHVRVCVRACVRACMRACVHACMHECVREAVGPAHLLVDISVNPHFNLITYGIFIIGITFDLFLYWTFLFSSLLVRPFETINTSRYLRNIQ